MRGGIAERGGVRVGHRIIEINGQSVVATPHEKIVHILSNAVGEVRQCNTLHVNMWHCVQSVSQHSNWDWNHVAFLCVLYILRYSCVTVVYNVLCFVSKQIHMKTMPAAMYRLLTAQEQPVYI